MQNPLHKHDRSGLFLFPCNDLDFPFPTAVYLSMENRVVSSTILKEYLRDYLPPHYFAELER